MKLNLGGTIRSMRQAQGKTQEQLARALDVTSQAVSRWEAQGSYPDMELIPAIANFFGVTIDQLFGYENQREAKIDALLERVRELDRANLGTDETVEECIRLLREGVAEISYHKGIGKQAEKLPDFWPVWCWPECDGIWQEIQADPRFTDWLRRTNE